MKRKREEKSIIGSNKAENDDFTLLFIGTGASTGVPEMGHVIRKSCGLCLSAFTDVSSKNRRNNVSIALLFKTSDHIQRCILIDAGKTMRDACMKQLYKHAIEQVDGIVLTHGHADAMLGLDDVRDFQKAERHVFENGDIGCRVVSGALPIYAHGETLKVVGQCFSYLLNKPEFFEGTDILKRRVAYLDFREIEPRSHIEICGMPIECFPVYHGGTYISLGFSIGAEGELVYISDVKIIPDATFEYLQSLKSIKLLVLDVLSPDGIYSHLGLREALDIVDRLKPMRTLFTGMSCYLGNHDDVCAQIAATHPSVSLAYDGLTIDQFKMR
jgi:phosphoribosyl 1,2-cyclic phosphodiesterase